MSLRIKKNVLMTEQFKNLKIGDLFKRETDHVFIKIIGYGSNSVNLNTGDLVHIDQHVDIIPLDGELIVKEKLGEMKYIKEYELDD